MSVQASEVRSPYFDELEVGQTFVAPDVTLNAGMQGVHASIVGNRLPLALDYHRAIAVAGAPVPSPALVWDVSIGQSTLATQHVRANLFYRGLWFSRLPHLGDTLKTSTVVEALRENTRRPGRPATGLAVLRITTVDQDDRPVLDYRRCAMLLLSPGAAPTGREDPVDAGAPGPEVLGSPGGDVFASIKDWRLDSLPRAGVDLTVGQSFDVLGGDVVSSAPELARITGNVARVHHDAAAAGGERLVYGGHTIGLAFHHVTQALPGILTVAGWHGCDHLAAVHEGDVLGSTVEVESLERGPGDVTAVGLQVTTRRREDDGVAVLSWRPVVLVA